MKFCVCVPSMALGAIIFGEAWYMSLRWVPPFLGVPLGLYLQRENGRNGKLAAAVSTISTISILWQALWNAVVWHLAVDDLTCVRFTPNIRNLSKCFFQKRMKGSIKIKESPKKVRVLDGFQQQVSRFLFEPKEQFWTIHDQIEVQTTLPDGSVETKSWLRRGKGVCGLTRAGDLDATASVKAPYSFLRADQSKAVVRVWSKTVDDSFRAEFQMKQLWPIEDSDEVSALMNPLTAEEQVAFDDFKRALGDLLSADGLSAGTIWKCTQKKTTTNKHLAIEGKLSDVLQFLKEHSLAARHYFRCSVVESSVIANMGFCKRSLKISPGKPETPIVLYIREGTKQHACAQTLEVFANDTRVPDRSSNEIVGSFGRCERGERLGAGGYGQVYKVQVGSEKFALKLANQRNNENLAKYVKEVAAMETEIRIAKVLQHRFFVKIYTWGVEWPQGQDFPEVPRRGILMELGGQSLYNFVLEDSIVEESKILDPNWLKQCREIMAQIIAAIEYMHSRRVVHCDLKAENILLNSASQNVQTHFEIKLIDFGCAQQFDGEKMYRRNFGTLAYQAPEVKSGKGYGMKCDVYSAGMTFDAMLRRRCIWCEAPKNPDRSRYCLWPDKDHSAPPGSPVQVKNLLRNLQCEEERRYSASDAKTNEFFKNFSWENCHFPTISWNTYN